MSAWVRRGGNPSHICQWSLVPGCWLSLPRGKSIALCNDAMLSLKAPQPPFPRLKLFLSVFVAGSPAWEGRTLKEKERCPPAGTSSRTSSLRGSQMPAQDSGLSKQGEGQACRRAVFA